MPRNPAIKLAGDVLKAGAGASGEPAARHKRYAIALFRLTRELGRRPEVRELAKALDWSPAQVMRVAGEPETAKAVLAIAAGEFVALLPSAVATLEAKLAKGSIPAAQQVVTVFTKFADIAASKGGEVITATDHGPELEFVDVEEAGDGGSPADRSGETDGE